MNRLRRWMIEKFLPRYAHELLLDELAATDKRLAAARQTIAEFWTKSSVNARTNHKQ